MTSSCLLAGSSWLEGSGGTGDKMAGRARPPPSGGRGRPGRAVATLGDDWVLEVSETDVAGHFLLPVGEQGISSHGFGGQRNERAASLSGLHTLSCISSELKVLALATQTSLYKSSELFGFWFLLVSQSEAASLRSAAFPCTGLLALSHQEGDGLQWGTSKGLPLITTQWAHGAPHLSGPDL